ncbi:LysE family transporter [Desulfolutivibrio sp.]|uniref:LysE family transporter n=1 Tax=Desulfolutivibrio sp. TaxID=2773296 RepID=UPI002F967A34
MTDIPAFFAAGAALGASAGFSPGPLLTLVMAQTLAHGPREGVKVAMAPLLTDVPMLAASLLALSFVQDRPAILGVLSLAGAAVVAFYGWECLRARPLSLPDIRVAPGSLKKGVIANFLNPHPYVFWATVGAPATLAAARSPGGLGAAAAFLSGFYLCLVGAKVCAALVTGRFRSFLGSRGYALLMRLLGLALFVFAAFFVRDAGQFFGLFP